MSRSLFPSEFDARLTDIHRVVENRQITIPIYRNAVAFRTTLTSLVKSLFFFFFFFLFFGWGENSISHGEKDKDRILYNILCSFSPSGLVGNLRARVWHFSFSDVLRLAFLRNRRFIYVTLFAYFSSSSSSYFRMVNPI